MSVEVMSLAECTATSMRPSSSASSSSFTKTPRSPISPNGLVRSRSPAVVIGTSAISMPGRAQRCGGQLRLRQREPDAARRRPGRASSTSRPSSAEQVPDRGSAYASPSSVGGRLLHPHGRQVQELVHDLRGHRLDRAALALGQASSRSPPSPARPARISSARARSDAIAGTTSSDACHSRNRSASCRDDRLGPLGLARGGREASRRRRPRGRRCRRGSSRRARATAGSTSRGTAMSMKKSGRPLRRRDVPGRDQEPGALVDETTTSTSPSSAPTSSSASAVPPKRVASSGARLACGSRRTRSRRRAPRGCPAASSLDLAGADEQDRRPVRSPKTCCASAAAADETDAGLSPIAVSVRTCLPDVERLAEDPVEQRPVRAGLVGVAHLAEDLALARDERVEPGGDAEEMQRRRVVVHAGRASDLGSPSERLRRALARPRSGSVVREVELGAVAGREADRLAAPASCRASAAARRDRARRARAARPGDGGATCRRGRGVMRSGPRAARAARR